MPMLVTENVIKCRENRKKLCKEIGASVMIKPIVKDVNRLKIKSRPAVRSDVQIGQDLRDTLNANRANCVGMAANMIGVSKRILIVALGQEDLVMYNPVLIKKSGKYETEEGCLSLLGVRSATRYDTIEVMYKDEAWQSHRRTFTGFIAQVIQHELDHLQGIII